MAPISRVQGLMGHKGPERPSLSARQKDAIKAAQPSSAGLEGTNENLVPFPSAWGCLGSPWPAPTAERRLLATNDQASANWDANL